jgi:hypothetical protein
MIAGLSVAITGCGDETDALLAAEASARDELAAELGDVLCGGASACCGAFGYDEPGEACRTSMRNAVMIRVIEAEDEGRTLVAERVDPCLTTFEDLIADTDDCAALPAPGELLRWCPDLFTPAERQAVRKDVACPHDEATCGYGAGSSCDGDDCYTLVFENVCR